MKKIQYLTALFAIFVLVNGVHSQISVDIETGMVYTGYNDARIPGTTGTLFSFSEDLHTDPALFFRVRLSYSLNPRHTLSLLIAPLSLKPTGRFDEEVRFEEETFSANTPIDATYRFNSYRLTYRYELRRSPKLDFGLGLTAKIRDAEIRLSSADTEAVKPDLGFVPLIHFRLFWKFQGRLGLLVNGDALAAPQGRAEDVSVALTYRTWDRMRVRIGYRILEGGADVDEVYTFSLFHYAVLGMTLTF